MAVGFVRYAHYADSQLSLNVRLPCLSKSLTLNTDSLLGAIQYVGGDTNGDGLIDSAETWTFQAQYTIPMDAAGGLSGTAVVSSDVAPMADTNPANNSADWNLTIGEFAALSGFAWVDFNNDGLIDFNERAIEGATITLQGADYLNNEVIQSVQTDVAGYYSFDFLLPGTYSLIQTQPAGYIDGIDHLGTAGGVLGNDQITGISLDQGTFGINYNFGERPLAGGTITAGQTATIGFWQNKNGQALLTAVNAGLGNWLAATFPSLYANLAGKTNSEVAKYYVNMFKAKNNIKGPAKVDCQVLATAFAVYATNQSLAGTAATNYGFIVSEYGVGTSTWNVGTSGAAFGVANYTTVTVLDLLLATNNASLNGALYNYDVLLRTLANAVYTAINEAGDIG